VPVSSNLYYTHNTTLNYNSSIVNMLGASLTDDARVIIYDRHMFSIVQVRGQFLTLAYLSDACLSSKKMSHLLPKKMFSFTTTCKRYDNSVMILLVMILLVMILLVMILLVMILLVMILLVIKYLRY